VWIPEEVQAFATRFASLNSDWEASTDTDLLDLEGTLCIPDFRFRHRATGRTVYLELFGFWRRNGVEERLAQLEAAGRKDILIAVGQRGRVSEEDLEAAPDRVYYFRGVMIPREVLQLLERVSGEEIRKLGN
jgi:predicted nuclease of restriction endonuclease-like RecB superfamily